MEPYETRAPDGTPIYYYGDQHLVPPPPPPRHRKHLLLILAIAWLVAVLALVSTSAIIYYQRRPSLPIASQPSPTLTPLQTTDFSKFFETFSYYLDEHDYDLVQSATDTENFQAIALRTSSCCLGWFTLYNQLTSGQLSFSLINPPIDINQAGDACFGYGPTGIAYLNLSIDAKQLEYAAGTTHEAGLGANDVTNAPYGTVFVFGLPNDPSATWLWRTVTFNNSLGCG